MRVGPSYEDLLGFGWAGRRALALGDSARDVNKSMYTTSFGDLLLATIQCEMIVGARKFLGGLEPGLRTAVQHRFEGTMYCPGLADRPRAGILVVLLPTLPSSPAPRVQNYSKVRTTQANQRSRIR